MRSWLGLMAVVVGVATACQTESAGALSAQDEQMPSRIWDTLNGVGTGTLLRLDSFPSDHISDRPLDVWLPSSYDGKRKHAVLVMYDGQMLFDATQTWNHKEWRVDEVVDSLVRRNEIIPPIVVALHNGGVNRNFEYFPEGPFSHLDSAFADSLLLSVAERYGAQGRMPVQSDAYLRYVVQEVLPMIEEEFAVYSDRSTRVIAGSSMGGLMSMYAIGEYPEVFGTALCLSTHWPGGFKPNETVPGVFASYVGEKLTPERTGKIYFDYGTETLDGMYEPFQKGIDSILTQNGFQRGENWETKAFIGAEHDEVSWARRLHEPLLFALKKQR